MNFYERICQIRTPPRGLSRTYFARWHTLRSRVAIRGLLGTILTVGGLTFLVKIVSAGKETFVARQLGVGDALDAFLIAFTLPALAMGIIAHSFNAALIPTYVQIRERGRKTDSQQLFSGVMFWSVGLLLFISGLLALMFPLVLPFLASGFSPEKIAFTQRLFWVLLPIITISGIGTIWGAVLNAEGEFVIPAITPIITSLVVATALFFRAQTGGIWGLTFGTLAGACLEVTLLGSCLKRCGISLLPRWQWGDADLRQVMGQYGPVAAAMLVFSGTSLADQAIAARLGSGNVAALNYGNKITALAIGVTATAVSTSVLPHFSRLVAIDDWAKISSDLKLYTLLILTVLIPISLLLFLFSVPLVHLVFERGAFKANDTQIVGHVQAYFALQIPFFTLGIMYVRLVSALKMNNYVFWIASISVLFNFVFDVIFAKYLGVAGIALSTTAVSFISAGLYYLLLHRTIPKMAAIGINLRGIQ
jgi:putative peptidoglycan lipid II flippase